MELNEVVKPKVYNMHEVADFMKVSYITLFRMVKSGRIKAINIAKTGKRPIYGFKAEDVKAYYEKTFGKGNPEKNIEGPMGS